MSKLLTYLDELKLMGRQCIEAMHLTAYDRARMAEERIELDKAWANLSCEIKDILEYLEIKKEITFVKDFGSFLGICTPIYQLYFIDSQIKIVNTKKRSKSQNAYQSHLIASKTNPDFANTLKRLDLLKEPDYDFVVDLCDPSSLPRLKEFLANIPSD